jgi:hypothetical protein
MIFYNHK